MAEIQYREANESDIPAMAQLRSDVWGTEEYWIKRISGYMRGETDPQQALKPRIFYIALEDGETIGFIAGHLTHRYECEGELEWINVVPEYRGKGISRELLQLLARWFAGQNSLHVCVNVDPANAAALNFYRRHGADNLNEHWLVWKDISVVLGNKYLL